MINERELFGYRDAIERNESYNVQSVGDVHAATTLILYYLSVMPESVITEAVYNIFVSNEEGNN